MSEYHISIFSLRLQISFLLQFVVQLDGWDQRSRGFLLFVGKENGLVKSKYLLLNFHYLAAYQQACNVCIAHPGICTRKLVCLVSLGGRQYIIILSSLGIQEDNCRHYSPTLSPSLSSYCAPV